jgi:hypothetical protein
MAHISDHARIRTVLGERSVSDLRQRTERLGEQQPVKAVVRFCRESQHLPARVPATRYGGVHVKEVARQGAPEQSADLVRDGVIGMQDGPDGKLNRRGAASW